MSSSSLPAFAARHASESCSLRHLSLVATSPRLHRVKTPDLQVSMIANYQTLRGETSQVRDLRLATFVTYEDSDSSHKLASASHPGAKVSLALTAPV